MKKLFLFLSVFLAALSFNSCNNDDEDNNPQIQDKIIGEWKLNQEFLNNEEQLLDDCDKRGIIEFFIDGTYTEKDFQYDESLGNCQPLETVHGTWEYLGSSMYKISDISSVPGVDIALEVKITFVSNSMIVEFSETIEGVDISLKFIFIKVNI